MVNRWSIDDRMTIDDFSMTWLIIGSFCPKKPVKACLKISEHLISCIQSEIVYSEAQIKSGQNIQRYKVRTWNIYSFVISNSIKDPIFSIMSSHLWPSRISWTNRISGVFRYQTLNHVTLWQSSYCMEWDPLEDPTSLQASFFWKPIAEGSEKLQMRRDQHQVGKIEDK
jgi:hypothetical protein